MHLCTTVHLCVELLQQHGSLQHWKALLHQCTFSATWIMYTSHHDISTWIMYMVQLAAAIASRHRSLGVKQLRARVDSKRASSNGQLRSGEKVWSG